MQFGGISGLAVLSALVASNRYYLKHGKNLERSHFIHGVQNRKFDQLVVDLVFTNYLHEVSVIYAGLPRNATPKLEIWIRYYVGLEINKSFYTCQCYEATNSCKCTIGNYVRLITLIASFTLQNMTMEGYEMMAEYYVGCFNVRKEAKELQRWNNLQECSSDCLMTNLYGMNSEGRCMCIENVTIEVFPVKLDMCTAKCPVTHQLCGSNEHFSVYSKITDRYSTTFSTPSEECIFNDEDCIDCPSGRKGMQCEIIDCSDHDGNCQERECQSIVFENMLHSVCACREGYYVGTRFTCHDIDECNDDDHKKCDTESTYCINEPGNYSCLCLPGYSSPSKVVSSSYSIKCNDNDECAGTNQCHENSTLCRNYPGSYTCHCLGGFKYLNDFRCQDIDECAVLEHICGKDSSCINTLGSFDCDCPPGSVKSIFPYAVECDDKDECSEENLCDASVSICLNTIYSYICLCRPGFVNIDTFFCEKAPSTKATTLHGDSFEFHTTIPYLNFTLDPNFENYVLGFFLSVFLLVLLAITMCGRFIVACLKETGVIDSSSTISESPTIPSGSH